jgi:hypothetical protein
MAVEDHPKFPEFLRALNRWIDARKAFGEGQANKKDVSEAEEAYNKIVDELDS